MRALLVVMLLATTAGAHRPVRVPPVPAPASQSDRHAIRKVIKKHLPKIFMCFEQDGVQTTRVVVDFTIVTSGKVTATSTKSPGSQTLQQCVADVFAKMTFARQASPVRVSYPVQICVAGQ